MDEKGVDPFKKKSFLDKVSDKIKPAKSATPSHVGMQPHHHHINLLLIITIFLIVVILIMLKPALVGYKVTKQFEEIGVDVSEFMKEVDTIRGENIAVKTTLESCEKTKEEYLSQASGEKNNTYACIQQVSELKAHLDQANSQYTFNVSQLAKEYDQKKAEVQLNLTQMQTQYSQLQTTYDTVVSSAADNICCKARVDDKSVDSYIVSNGRIICTSGEEDKISC